ncbi:MAG: hypothetical protein ABFC67_04945 [Mizugakiibacter sp.]|uniref:hypothetical protein n=1 Tax=Mizugakiibacter sp. TaxID=1972610 RepID=UPI0032102E1B
MEIRFSQRGDRPTTFERGLVSEAPTCLLTETRQLWLLIAERIGLEALLVVLDEIGGEKVHVPTRADFFGALWRPVRDAEIRRLKGQGFGAKRIAKELGMTRSAVQLVLHAESRGQRAGRRWPAGRASKRA